MEQFDIIVIGAGSAGCAVAAGLAQANVGSVAVLEAGPSDAAVRVKVPFGLLFTMGSTRDWRWQSTLQSGAGRRRVKVPRGRMLGGSSSINSMVWFRGRQDDFDAWGLPGWGWTDVAPAFDEVEAAITPQRLPDPHPMSEAFGRALGDNGQSAPTPERESAGVFNVNMRRGRRWSAADAFLRPAQVTGRLAIFKGAVVDRIGCIDSHARQVSLTDGRVLTARRGIVLSAGSLASPAILMRSGLGPAAHLKGFGIDVLRDLPGVGANLHDHPAVGLHHAGVGSGYGLTFDQALAWAWSPFEWLRRRRGRMTSNFVEAGAFFRAAPVGPDGDDRPDCQVHFIPYMMGYQGRQITTGSGYFADVCVCRPASRGRLGLTSADPNMAPAIDLGLFNEPEDLELLTDGVLRLRELLAQAPFDSRRAPEVYPADTAKTRAEVSDYIRTHCGTAYHPVGTLAMGLTTVAPVAPDLAVKGVRGLWVADASVMPRITSANTNAPSMMIGHRAAQLISQQLKA